MQIARLFIRLHLPFHVRKIGKTFGPRPQGTAQQKEPRGHCILGAPDERRRLPTLPHYIAVPSAQVGLTSLFGMGRGGTPPL